jgi:tetratricopeptide (TPR) repeat protein
MLIFHNAHLLKTRTPRRIRGIMITFTALVMMLAPSTFAQQALGSDAGGVAIRGTVLGVDGKPVSGAVVHLGKRDLPNMAETRSDAGGTFVFSSLPEDTYQLSAEKPGLESPIVAVSTRSTDIVASVDLVLKQRGMTQAVRSTPAPEAQAMEFSDQPDFVVAGVTDWTAIGGHGSDSILRTSEALADETAELKPQMGTSSKTAGADASKADESESELRAMLARAPGNFELSKRLGELYLHNQRYVEAIPILESAYRSDQTSAALQYDLVQAYEKVGELPKAGKWVHQLLAEKQSGALYRLAGDLDEKLGNPLLAVHEDELAAKLDPSEQNYFAWGSELLLHRAVWQAQEVFQKGAAAYPTSVRMQTAIGTSLFAEARYDEAAVRLCNASDMDPADPTLYIFMGKIQMAAPNPLACVEPKLARFLHQQPENSTANYLYAMSILKTLEQAPDKQEEQKAEGVLLKAVALDSKCSGAYLQLGVIAASQRLFDKAIDFYGKAIETDPQLADAHYRLGVAYERIGQPAKAKQEFLLHDQIERQQADVVDKQRREVKQFTMVQAGTAHSAVQ